jgi:MFS family permease
MADSFAALRHPGVARFAIGRFFSAMATTSVSVAVGWQLYERTGSALALGLTGLAEVVPVVGLSLLAGVAADRYPRRLVAIAAHLTLAACAASLYLLARYDGPPPAYYAVLFLQGTAMAFRSPSVGSMLPQLVPARDYTNANAWFSSTYELAGMAGPAIAGLLIAAVASSWLAFAFACVSHLVFVGILSSLPHRPAVLSGKTQRLSDLLVGLTFVFGTPELLSAITLDLFAVLLGGATALLPIYAKDVLQVGPVGLGWLRAAPALGAVTMAVLQTRLPPWKKPGQVLLLTVAGFGLSTIGFGLSRVMLLSWAMLFLTGVFDNVSVVIRSTLEQSLTPDSMRGRVSAIYYVFIGMSNELGSFESGATAALFGPILSVVGGGLGTLAVVGLVGWRFKELLRLPPLYTLKPLKDPSVAEEAAPPP